eukprot:gene3163-5906_t
MSAHDGASIHLPTSIMKHSEHDFEDHQKQSEDDSLLWELSQLSMQRATDVAHFRKTRNALEAEIARLQAISEEREVKCKRLECDLARAHRDMLKQEQSRLEAEMRANEAENEIPRLRRDLQDIKQAKANDNQRMAESLASTQKQLKRLYQENTILINNNQKQEQRISELEKLSKDTQQALHDMQQNESIAKSKCNDLLRRADLATEGEEAALSALNAAHGKIASLEALLQCSKDENAQTVLDLKARINQLLPLQSRAPISVDDYHNQQTAIDEMQHHARSLRSEIELKDIELTALRKSEASLKGQLDAALTMQACLAEQDEQSQQEREQQRIDHENALQKLANRVSQLQQELSGANRREHQHSVDMQTLVFKITHTTDGILRIMNNIYDVMSIDAGLSASHSTNKLAASTENEDFDKDLSNSENYGTDTGSTHSMSHEQKLGNQHHNKSKQSNRLDSNKRDPSSVTEALVQRMQHMQAIATRLEECYERHRQKHKEEITRQDHHLRESWDVVRSQEAALREREHAITSLKQQIVNLEHDFFEERQAFANEKRTLMQHLGRLEAQSNELRGLQNDHVKQLTELHAILKKHEQSVNSVEKFAANILDNPHSEKFRPPSPCDMTTWMEAIGNAVRSLLEEREVAHKEHQEKLVESNSQLQLLQRQLTSVLEERRALQEKLAGTDAEMEQLARQRSLESQQHNRDSNMIVELQNKIVSAMHTLQREQSVNQTLQQKLDRSDQLWKTEWQACHSIIGCVRKAMLALAERLARILAVARYSGPALAQAADCISQIRVVMRSSQADASTGNAGRKCWSLKTAALVVIACCRLEQRRSLLDPDIVAASWRRAYRPRTPTHNHIEDLDDMDDDELIELSEKHVEISNQMIHFKRTLLGNELQSPITDDMRPVRAISDVMSSFLAAFGVEVPSRFGLRLTTWYPQRRVYCEFVQQIRLHTRELQSRIDALISDVEVLETTNASLKTKNFHQSNQIESINARVNELDATNQRIYNQLHELGSTRVDANLYRRLRQEFEKSKEYIAQMKPLSETTMRQERMLRQMQQELQKKEIENENRVETLNEKLHDALRQIDDLKRELEVKSSKHKVHEQELHATIDHLQHSRATLLSELQELTGMSTSSAHIRPTTAGSVRNSALPFAITHSTPMVHVHSTKTNNSPKEDERFNETNVSVISDTTAAAEDSGISEMRRKLHRSMLTQF